MKITLLPILYLAGVMVSGAWLLFSQVGTFAAARDESLAFTLHRNASEWRLISKNENFRFGGESEDSANDLLKVFLAKNQAPSKRMIAEYDRLAVVAGVFCLLGLLTRGNKFYRKPSVS